MSYTSTLVLLLQLIYLSYLSNVYRACSFFTNSELFCIDNVRVIYRKYGNFSDSTKQSDCHVNLSHYIINEPEMNMRGL
jgi:hypothetical protein